MSPRITRLRAALAILLWAGTMVAACRREAPVQNERAQETMVAVGAEPAETAGIRAVIHASGVIVPSEGAELLIIAPELARVVEVSKAQGDAVRSGEVLVRFDLPSTTQDVARLTAELAGAQAQVENARIAQARARDFVERGLLPRRDVEVADRELADAQAAAERARMAQAAAQAASARASVRAPFDGIVATRLHGPGDLVQPTGGDAVLRVVDPRRLEVRASVPTAEIARVLPGATARIAGTGAGGPVRLTVASRLASEPGASDGMRPVRLVFDMPSTLPVDTRIEVDIDAEERSNVVLVPLEALVQDGGQSAVMVAVGARAERRVVTTGIVDEQRIEITSGVKAGELIVTRGHVGLADGAAISVAVSSAR